MTCSQRKTTRQSLWEKWPDADLTARSGVLSEFMGTAVLDRVDVESVEERIGDGAAELTDGVDCDEVLEAFGAVNCPPVPRGFTSHLQL
jgi:hypothetical protein